MARYGVEQVFTPQSPKDPRNLGGLVAWCEVLKSWWLGVISFTQRHKEHKEENLAIIVALEGIVEGK